MRKKKIIPEDELIRLESACETEHSHWNALYKNGCSDPFYADGVNLMLTRNHIIYYKRKISELCAEYGLEKPSVLYRPLPPKVSQDYVAGKSEIKRKATAFLDEIDSSPEYAELLERRKRISPNQAEQTGLEALLASISNFRDAVSRDEYLTMRNMLRSQDYYTGQISNLLTATEQLPFESYQLKLSEQM